MSDHRGKVSKVLAWTALLAAGVATAGEEAMQRVMERENYEKEIGVVEAVNVENRIATVRSLARDDVMVMEVGPEVRNLAQVEQGDRVVVEYAEAVAVDLKKGGGLERTKQMAEARERARPGDKPAGGIGRSLVVVADIVGIDPDEPSVSLQGPDVGTLRVILTDPDLLQGVEIGDQVVLTYQRAIAISVRPAP